MNYIPTVIVKDGNTERAYDIFSMLLKDRIVWVSGEVSKQTADIVIPQILYLNQQDKDKDIHLYINSPGGSVYDGLAMIDIMNMVSNDISTYCMGMCCSMGAMILSAGTKGKRYITENSMVMIHSVSSGTKGTVHDMQISFNESNRLQKSLMKMLAKNCGKTIKTIEKDCDRDYYMNAEESLKYGIVDNIINK